MTQYSTRNFMRRAPNGLLAEYFGAREVAIGIDVSALEETDVEPIYEAWLKLDDAQRQRAETDFRDIQELANDLGIGNVISLAAWDNIDLNDILAAMDDVYDRSFWVFLNHPGLFAIALRLLETDRLSNRSWRKRKGLPKRTPQIERAPLERLRDGIIDYYRRTEARGHHCHTEYVARGDKHYFFACAEDYSRAEQDFEQGLLRRRRYWCRRRRCHRGRR